MINILYDSYRILEHVYSEKTFLKQAIKSEVIEPLNRRTVIKICYGVLDKDITLSWYISKLCDKNPKLPIRIILKISFYEIAFLNTAGHAVTDNAVELCKKLGKGGAAGFVNAVLRRFIREKDSFALPCGNDLHSLSIKYSYPEFALKKLINAYGLKTAVDIISYDKPYVFLRFFSDEKGENYLTERNLKFEKLPVDGCFCLENFVRDDGFDKGEYTYQSIGSAAICEVVGGGENLLDCCAAPGGKSVNLSRKFKSVVSCDVYPHRVELIKEYAERMGVKNVTAMVCDATVKNDEFIEKFDSVLCDCPCSGFGVTLENPDIKLNRTEEAVAELCALQLKILNNCFAYVKKGGALYYSTCSILKEENDDLIAAFLKGQQGAKVCEISSPLGGMRGEYGITFLPNQTRGAGFYICKIVRS